MTEPGWIRCPLCHDVERVEDMVGGVCLTCADGIAWSQNARRGAVEVLAPSTPEPSADQLSEAYAEGWTRAESHYRAAPSIPEPSDQMQRVYSAIRRGVQNAAFMAGNVDVVPWSVIKAAFMAEAAPSTEPALDVEPVPSKSAMRAAVQNLYDNAHTRNGLVIVNPDRATDAIRAALLAVPARLAESQP